jgi:hypothetical protein
VKSYRVGQWVQWQTDQTIKRGEVLHTEGPSMVVRWLDGVEQVFPVIEYVLAGARLDVIERPKEASRIERDRRRGVMSIQRAAATLGTSPKRVRAMIRSGELTGVKKEGKWVSVELAE